MVPAIGHVAITYKVWEDFHVSRGNNIDDGSSGSSGMEKSPPLAPSRDASAGAQAVESEGPAGLSGKLTAITQWACGELAL